MSTRQQNTAKKCSRRCSGVWHRVFPHLFLVFLLLMYAVFGAILFERLEGTNDSAEGYDTFLNKLWEIANETLANETHANEAHANETHTNETAKYQFKNRVREQMKYFQIHWSDLKENETQWNFLGSLFFCCTVFTTVGYGHIFPLTIGGKIACMFYATFGIPIMLLVVTDVGDMLAALLSKIYNKVRRQIPKNISPPPSETPSRWSSFKQSLTKSKTKPEARSVTFKNGSQVIITPMNLKNVLNTQSSVKRKSEMLRNAEIFEKLIVQEHMNQNPLLTSRRDRSKSCPELDVNPVEHDLFFPRLGQELEKFDVPIIIIIGVVFAYLLFGAGILRIWENWDYLNSFYFYFITITTIGFGDFFPEHPNFLMIVSLLIITGMAIMSMAFKLTQNRIAFCYRQVTMWIHGGKQNKF
ncbi:potassium channel subfamily K member 18 [Mobula birostris]|uniref:potassium channel subfamily K member 18 n=1 Tax=Mobula birostris TaxID=1983395 RepID=UPI003B27ED0D